MRSIKSILMERDGMTAEEASALIKEARECFFQYLSDGDIDSADNICEEFFGLEPDYIDQIMFC